MAGLGPFYIDAEKRSKRRNRIWYQKNIMRVLQDSKEKQARGVDATIALAEELLAVNICTRFPIILVIGKVIRHSIHAIVWLNNNINSIDRS